MGASVVGAVAGTAFAATAAGAVASTVVTGALVGAAVGGISAAVTGGNVLKGALVGGVVGGVSAGIGAAVGGAAGGLARGVSGAAGTMATSGANAPGAYDVAGDQFMQPYQVESSLPTIQSSIGSPSGQQQGGGFLSSPAGGMVMKAGIDMVGGMAKGYAAADAAKELEESRVKSRAATPAGSKPATFTMVKDDVAQMTAPDQQAMSYRVFQKPLEIAPVSSLKPAGAMA